MFAVDHHLPLVLEVHGDATVDVRLDLSDPPVRLRRVADQHARLQKCADITHRFPLTPTLARAGVSADGAHGGSRRASRDLSALLGSRICHDLISPLGAISNGVELLSMSGISAAPEIALISESVENANARIRFFRIAFGSTAPGQAVPLGEVQQILADLSRGGRLSIYWDVSEPLERDRVKLAFLLLQCLETAMPFGGDVTVSGTDGPWTLTGRADRLKIDLDLWALLAESGPEAEVSPAHVHFALVGDAALRAGRSISTDLQDTEIRIVI